MHDVNDITLLCALTDNILAAQRGRPYPGLDSILSEDPTVGIPPDVRRALLTVAQERGADLMFDVRSEEVSNNRRFVCCEFGPTLPASMKGLSSRDVEDQNNHRPVAATAAEVALFFRKHRLEAPRAGADDEHYAERLFIERVVAPVIGAEGLRRITPQEPFIDLDGKQRRIDFVLRGQRAYALEVEGATYHAEHNLTAGRYDDETKRRRALDAHEYHYQPFTYTEIISGEALRAFQRLCATDKQLAPLMDRSALPPEETAAAERDANAARLLVWAPERFTQVQRALVPMLANWMSEGKQEAHVCSLDAEVGILNLAFEELLTCAHYVARFFGLDVILPRVFIYTDAAERSDTPGAREYDDILIAYRKDRLEEAGMTSQVTHLHHDANTQTIDFDAVFSVEAPRDAPMEMDGLPVYTLIVPSSVEYPANLVQLAIDRFQSRAPDDETLHYFARRLFNISSLKDQQLTIIKRLLAGGSQLAILPTAFGKSLCYQLPAILIPGVIFVVSPLRALMRDQMLGLETKGLTCAGAIMFEDSSAEKQQKLQRLKGGRFRLFYLAPERFQVYSFALELMQVARAAGSWALGVDEAHCVSEWGHEFRVAYLQLGRLKRTLEKAQSRDTIPVIALTATASQNVADDVCHYLDIASGDIIRLGTMDRSDISLSVHPVTPEVSKPQLLQNLVAKTIPRILGRSLLPEDDAAKKQMATIIFAPYTNAHGQSTADENCVSIAQNLIKANVLDRRQIQTYGSGQPYVCPKCGTADTIWDSNDSDYRCRACEEHFANPTPLIGSQQEYDKHMKKVQEDFSANQYPMLVATKGFGMGIDKRNIRVVAHYAFADGIEAYIQEMGRAARDHQPAHAALIYSPPTAECSQYLQKGANDLVEAPRCVSDDTSYRWWKCPYGLSRLCDYGLKARNIRESYGSTDAAAKQAMEVFDRLVPEPNQPLPSKVELSPSEALNVSGHNSTTNGESDKSNLLTPLQFALYRLLVIGIVGDWFINYEQSLTNPILTVRLRTDWTLVVGKKNALDQLQRLRTGGAQSVDSALEGVAPNDMRAQVEHLVAITVRATFDAVRGMRSSMLHYELRYAQADQEAGDGKATCRRVMLQQGMGEAKDVIRGCDSCDVCCPSLAFDWKDAKHLDQKDTEALEVVIGKLAEAFDSFDIDLVTSLTNTATEHNGAVFLQNRAEQRLTEDPFNLTSRALAGLCARYRGLPDQAIYHFSSGFGAVERGLRDLASGMYFYQQLRELDALRALAILQRKGGLFDTPEGHTFAISELERAKVEGHADKASLEGARWLGIADEWKRLLTPRLVDSSNALAFAQAALNQSNHNGSIKE